MNTIEEHRAAGSFERLFPDLKLRLDRLNQKLLTADPAHQNELSNEFAATMAHAIPKALFVLVPFFALLLKLLFRKPSRYYVEHLVFAVHFHTFAFILLLPSLVVDSAPVTGAALIWLVVYLFLALRRAYESSRLGTAWRLGALSLLYSAAFVVTFAGIVVLSLIVIA